MDCIPTFLGDSSCATPTPIAAHQRPLPLPAQRFFSPLAVDRTRPNPTPVTPPPVPHSWRRKRQSAQAGHDAPSNTAPVPLLAPCRCVTDLATDGRRARRPVRSAATTPSSAILIRERTRCANTRPRRPLLHRRRARRRLRRLHGHAARPSTGPVHSVEPCRSVMDLETDGRRARLLVRSDAITPSLAILIRGRTRFAIIRQRRQHRLLHPHPHRLLHPRQARRPMRRLPGHVVQPSTGPVHSAARCKSVMAGETAGRLGRQRVRSGATIPSSAILILARARCATTRLPPAQPHQRPHRRLHLHRQLRGRSARWSTAHARSPERCRSDTASVTVGQRGRPPVRSDATMLSSATPIREPARCAR